MNNKDYTQIFKDFIMNYCAGRVNDMLLSVAEVDVELAGAIVDGLTEYIETGHYKITLTDALQNLLISKGYYKKKAANNKEDKVKKYLNKYTCFSLDYLSLVKISLVKELHLKHFENVSDDLAYSFRFTEDIVYILSNSTK